MKRVWATIQVLLIWMMVLGAACAGEVYTWTDAAGNVHITDRPPTDGAQIESVIRYSNRQATNLPDDPAQQQNRLETQQAEQLGKQLKRFKARKTQLEKSIAENQASIAAAGKDAEYYRKRSGSSARRNEKATERQLVVLNNNLTTYQSDMRYVEEDIAEAERLLEAIELKLKRPDGQSDPPPTN